MILVAMLFPIFMAFASPFSCLSAMLEPAPHDLAVEVISTTEEAPQIAPDLLPGFFRVLHRMLPSGASSELFRRVLYFDGAGIARGSCCW